jgi:hypothetical protein
MQRRITGFHLDQERHWVADLECGHSQHVRHEPPLTTRPWVLEQSTRDAHLGTLLDCLLCDETAGAGSDLPGLSAEARARYHDARLSGLCHEGALEAARRPTEPGP